jgi:hypothetical protein
MPDNDLVTFEDLYLAALRRVKGDSADAATLAVMKESISTRYRTICSRKKWKWLRVTDRSLKLNAAYTTGTISIANGSRTVTGLGTAWASTHRNWWLLPEGTDTSYRVIAVGSATSLTIASPLVESAIVAKTYKLYEGEIALFPNCEDIDDLRIDGGRVIEPRGPAEIGRLRRQYPTRTGAPELYSIEGRSVFSGPILADFVLGYDYLGSGLTKAMTFFPHIPDDDYTIQVAFKQKAPSLIAASDEPLLPIEHRHILLYYSLADWYMKDRQDATGRYYEGLASSELKEMAIKYLDTDDVLTFEIPDMGSASHSYLMRTSQSYFDTEG